MRQVWEAGRQAGSCGVSTAAAAMAAEAAAQRGSEQRLWTGQPLSMTDSSSQQAGNGWRQRQAAAGDTSAVDTSAQRACLNNERAGLWRADACHCAQRRDGAIVIKLRGRVRSVPGRAGGQQWRWLVP